jgi:5-(carboxyamino)imidazole ribonucleotide synthase
MVKRVGIIGGGQLAWMMADGAQVCGVELVVQTPSAQDPAVAIAQSTILAAIADATATAQLAHQTDVITFENEFVDLDALAKLEGADFRPKLATLRPLLDKYTQRTLFQQLGLPTPRVFPVEPTTLNALLPQLTYPIVAKTRRHGYDGQGTFIVASAPELVALVQRLGTVPLLLEDFVPFERELAVIAARSPRGEVALYPVVETQQKNQVCQRVLAPAAVSAGVVEQAKAIATTLLTALDSIGVIAIELFLTQDDQLLINEIAPRVHNSGHFSLDACITSQFEQHLRAVCDLPLGCPDLGCDGAVMVNLLGYESSKSDYLDQRQKLAKVPNAHVYWYGKTASRPGRKLGHVTVLLQGTEAERQQALALAQEIEAIWYPDDQTRSL